MTSRKSRVFPSRGSEKLKSLLSGPKQKARFSESFGVGQDVVSRWIHGKRKPDTLQLARLDKDYGIPWTDWDVPLSEPGGAPEPTFRGAA